MIRVCLLILLAAAFDIAIAQQGKIDSLESLLPGKTDLERADIFYELAYEYTDTNYALASEYSGQSLQFSKKTGDSLRIVKAGRIKASVFRRLEEMDSAIVLGLEILPIASRNQYRIEVKKILRGVALAYTYKANYDLGLRYNFELLKATEQDNDSVEMCVALNNIGLIYFKLSNKKKALEYYQRSVDVKLPLDKYPYITNTLFNMSLCYIDLKNFYSADEFIKKAFDSCEPDCLPFYRLEGLHARGAFYFLKGNLDSAEIYYLKAYSLAKKLDSRRFQLILVLNLTKLYFQREQISVAMKYLSEAESIMQNSPFGYELINLYSRFFSLYKKAGNKRKMVFYQEKYIQLNDSLYNEALTNNLMKIESAYLERANTSRIIEQEQLLALKDQVIKRQHAVNVLTGLITVLLTILLAILIRHYRYRQSANHVLDQKVKERTAALESNHFALKQLLGAKDAVMARAFIDIKSSTSFVEEMCSLGLALDEGHNGENRKYLQEICIEIGRISLVVNNIHANRMET
jgi:tetratricopeptide (TPR) repeat protein